MTDLSKDSLDKPNMPNQNAPCNQTPSTYVASQNVPSQLPEKESFWTWCCWCQTYLELKELHIESKQVICCNCRNIFVATEIDVPEQVKLKARQIPDRFKLQTIDSGTMQAPNSRVTKMTKREMLSGVGVSTKDGKGKHKKKRGLKKKDLMTKREMLSGVGVSTKDGKGKCKKKGGLKKKDLRQMLMGVAKKEIMSKLKTWNTPKSN